MKTENLKKITKIFIPLSIRNTLYSYYENEFKKQRRLKENALPKTRLTAANIANIEIVLDRRALLEKLPCNAIVAELGVDEGNFSELIQKINKPKILHLVDVWNSRRYDTNKFEYVGNRFASEINEGKIIIHRKLSTIAVDDFPDGYFDWIYIDTDHTYKTTKEELETYASKIKDGGFIAGHDYVLGNIIEGTRVGVIDAVHEFCVTFGWEFVYLTMDPLEIQSYAIKRIS